MKKRLYRFIIVLLPFFILILSGCKHSNDDPGTAIGLPFSWDQSYGTVETFRTRLKLKNNSTFEWIVLDTVSAHTNSYGKFSLSGNRFLCYDNPDCPENGIYQWSLVSGNLALAAVSENCAGRAAGLTGSWTAVDTTVYQRILGSWQKIILDQGIPYRVKLTLTSGGSLKWEMTDPIPGHTNSSVSFAATANTIIVYNDPDCDGNGYYAYTATDTTLAVEMIKDKCPPRAPSFSGTWVKYKP